MGRECKGIFKQGDKKKRKKFPPPGDNPERIFLVKKTLQKELQKDNNPIETDKKTMIEARLDTKGFAKMSSLLMEGGTGESTIKVKTL